MSPIGGYFGRYLHIDLDQRRSEAVPLSRAELRAVVGGVGLGALLLLRHSGAMVFAFGPLLGTPLTTSAKFSVLAKSPATERFCDALSSSDFAIEGKRTGFDAIVLGGIADEPSVALLDGERLSLMPAEELWSSAWTVPACTARLAERFPGYSFATAGPAAHHGVKFACLVNGGRHAGRGGLGTLLVDKRIKALGVRGDRFVPVADEARTVALAKDLARRSLGPATEKYRELGTVANLATFNRLATLPTRNFQASTFEGAQGLSGEALKTTRERGRGACRSCTIGCEHFYEVRPGEAPQKVEYENVFALGPLCGVSDVETVLRASRLCDELGMDYDLDGRHHCLRHGVRRARPPRRRELCRRGEGFALRQRPEAARNDRGDCPSPGRARRSAGGRHAPGRHAARARGRGDRAAREGARAAGIRAALVADDGAGPRRGGARGRTTIEAAPTTRTFPAR